MEKLVRSKVLPVDLEFLKLHVIMPLLNCKTGRLQRIATVIISIKHYCKSVATAANKNDQVAKNAYSTVGRFLGKGLAILIDILNPEMIVIGSIYTRDSHLLVSTMNEEIEKEALLMSRNVCKVVPAALGENIGDYAAFTVALYGEGYLHAE